MGFRFRKSIKAGPIRVNLSKSGIGYSVGGKGLRVTKKAGGGTRATVGIPGTGISYSTDSKKKVAKKNAGSGKATSANKGTAVATTSASITPAQSKGCGIGCLTFILAVGAFVWAFVNWKTFLLVVVLAAAAYIAIKFLTAKKERTNLPPSDDAPSAENDGPNPNEPAPEEDSPKTAFEIFKAERIEQFEEELQKIPIVDIVPADPAPRQLLKNMPEYSFSNITRKTRLDSIFPLVFLDVETTGFAPSKCEILEVSAIKFDGGMIPVSAFTTLCKPHKPIPEEASAVNHITEDMVADAPAFNQVASALTDFIKGCHIAGHNLDFDLRFIYAHGAQLPENVRFYDTLDLGHLTVPQSSVWNYKLDTLCHHYGIWRDEAHRSLSDCYATARLFVELVKDKTDRQLDVNADMSEEYSAE